MKNDKEKQREYTYNYYERKAIEFLEENGVAVHEHSIKRAMSYLMGKSSRTNYANFKAKVMDSNFMKFTNALDQEGKLYEPNF